MIKFLIVRTYGIFFHHMAEMYNLSILTFGREGSNSSVTVLLLRSTNTVLILIIELRCDLLQLSSECEFKTRCSGKYCSKYYMKYIMFESESKLINYKWNRSLRVWHNKINTI